MRIQSQMEAVLLHFVSVEGIRGTETDSLTFAVYMFQNVVIKFVRSESTLTLSLWLNTSSLLEKEMMLKFRRLIQYCRCGCNRLLWVFDDRKRWTVPVSGTGETPGDLHGF
jgi:hypothetical protein